MPNRTIIINGARGGQGTSTVAAAIALFAADHHRTVLASCDPGSMAALLGLPNGPGTGETEVTGGLRLGPDPNPDADVFVVDAGTSRVDDDVRAEEDRTSGAHVERYTVLRGPCYLALAAVVRNPGPPPDGVILVTEPGRSLSARDVTEVLGVPVVAQLSAVPQVARSIDAGLLPARLPRLSALTPLRRLAAQHSQPARPQQHSSGATGHRRDQPLRTHTDLPFPQAETAASRRPAARWCVGIRHRAAHRTC